MKATRWAFLRNLVLLRLCRYSMIVSTSEHKPTRHDLWLPRYPGQMVCQCDQARLAAFAQVPDAGVTSPGVVAPINPHTTGLPGLGDNAENFR